MSVECPLLVITGPSTLVHPPSVSSRYSAESPGHLSTGVTSFRRSDSSALSDSELDSVSVRSTASHSHSKTLRFRRKVAVSDQVCVVSHWTELIRHLAMYKGGETTRNNNIFKDVNAANVISESMHSCCGAI